MIPTGLIWWMVDTYIIYMQEGFENNINMLNGISLHLWKYMSMIYDWEMTF